MGVKKEAVEKARRRKGFQVKNDIKAAVLELLMEGTPITHHAAAKKAGTNDAFISRNEDIKDFIDEFAKAQKRSFDDGIPFDSSYIKQHWESYNEYLESMEQMQTEVDRLRAKYGINIYEAYAAIKQATHGRVILADDEEEGSPK